MDSPRSLSFSSNGSDSEFELISNCGSESDQPKWEQKNSLQQPLQFMNYNWFGWGAQPTSKMELPSSPNQTVVGCGGDDADSSPLKTVALSTQSNPLTYKRQRNKINPSKLNYARTSIAFGTKFKKVKKGKQYAITPSLLRYALRSLYLKSKLFSTYTYRARFKKEYDINRKITSRKLMVIKLFKPMQRVPIQVKKNSNHQVIAAQLFKPKNSTKSININVQKTDAHRLLAVKLFKPKVYAPTGPGKPGAKQKHQLCALKLLQLLSSSSSNKSKVTPVVRLCVNSSFNSVKIRGAALDKWMKKRPKRLLTTITPTQLNSVELKQTPVQKKKLYGIGPLKNELNARYLINVRRGQDKKIWSLILNESLIARKRNQSNKPTIPLRPLHKDVLTTTTTTTTTTSLSSTSIVHQLPIPPPPTSPLTQTYIKIPQYHLSFTELSSQNWLSQRVLRFKDGEISILKKRLEEMESENKVLSQQLTANQSSSSTAASLSDSSTTATATPPTKRKKNKSKKGNNSSNNSKQLPEQEHEQNQDDLSKPIKVTLSSGEWANPSKLLKNLNKFDSHPDNEVKLVYVEAFNTYYQMYEHQTVHMDPIDISDPSSLSTIRTFLLSCQQQQPQQPKPIPKQYTITLSSPTMNIKRLKQEFCIANGVIPSFSQISSLFEILQSHGTVIKAIANSKPLSQISKDQLQIKVVFPSFTNHPIAISSPRCSSHNLITPMIPITDIPQLSLSPRPTLPESINSDSALTPITINFNSIMINHVANLNYQNELAKADVTVTKPLIIPQNHTTTLNISSTSTPNDIIKFFANIYKLEQTVKIANSNTNTNDDNNNAPIEDEYRLGLLLFSPISNQTVTLGIHKPKISILSQIYTAQHLQFQKLSHENDNNDNNKLSSPNPPINLMLSYVTKLNKPFQPYPTSELITYQQQQSLQSSQSTSSGTKPSYYRLSIQFDMFYPQSAPLRFKLSPTTHTISLSETIITHILTKFNIADAAHLNMETLQLRLRVPKISPQLSSSQDENETVALIKLETFSSFETAVQLFDQTLRKYSPDCVNIDYSTVLFAIEASFEPISR